MNTDAERLLKKLPGRPLLGKNSIVEFSLQEPHERHFPQFSLGPQAEAVFSHA